MVPPAALTVTEPSVPFKHEASTAEAVRLSATEGSVMVTDPVVTQLLASVTVTV